jgi:sirohydrochlorin ferrochelatase
MARQPGILVISHGSRESGWVSLVDETVEKACASLPPGVKVEAAFLELVDGHLIQDGICRLEEAGVTHFLALPLFVSSGSTHVDEIGWALGAYPEVRTETDLEPFEVHAELTYGYPIDDDPEIADILLSRLAVLSCDASLESVLLICHGSEHAGFHEAWTRGMTSLASMVRQRGGYADAEIAMLRPDMAAGAVERLRERSPGTEILAVPVFLSEGYFTREVIPKRLEGLGCRYAGHTLMPHPLVVRWLVRQASEWLQQQG